MYSSFMEAPALAPDRRINRDGQRRLLGFSASNARSSNSSTKLDTVRRSAAAIASSLARMSGVTRTAIVSLRLVALVTIS
jgi:hypothetical protein